MLTYVLDASAAIRFVDKETGSDRVEELIGLAQENEAKVVISAVNWGEVVYILAARRETQTGFTSALKFLEQSIDIVAASAERAAHTALLKNCPTRTPSALSSPAIPRTIFASRQISISRPLIRQSASSSFPQSPCNNS